MTAERLNYLQTELDNEVISLAELVEIQEEFSEYEANGQLYEPEDEEPLLAEQKLSMIEQVIFEQIHFTSSRRVA